MTLLNASDLGVSPEGLRAAEAQVAAMLGAVSLETRQVAQAGFAVGNIIPLQDGPLTALTEFTLNGWATAPALSPWHVRVAQGVVMNGLASYAAAGAPYAMTYTAGWEADALPEPIREAVRQAALSYDAASGTDARVIAEKLGDVETRYAAPASAGSLPDALTAALAPYRRLRF